MDFNLGIGGGSTATTYDVTVTAPSSAYYTLNGQTREELSVVTILMLEFS